VAWEYSEITGEWNPSEAKKLQKIVLEALAVNYTRPALAIRFERLAANLFGPGVKNLRLHVTSLNTPPSLDCSLSARLTRV